MTRLLYRTHEHDAFHAGAQRRTRVTPLLRSLAFATGAVLVILPGRQGFAQQAETASFSPATEPPSSPPSPAPGAAADPAMLSSPPASSPPAVGSPPASSPPAVGSPPGAPSSPPPVAAHGSTSKDDPAKFEERTFLGDGPTDHGGYGGPLIRFSSFDGKSALLVGGKGGWLINHRLLIGGAGMGQALSIDAPPESVARYPQVRNVEFGYGGFLAGYHIAPEGRLHAVASVLLAGGGLVLSNRDVESEDHHDVGHDGDGVFVMEPELALEANLARFVRLQFAVSYRFVSDVELAGLDNADASGIAGGVAFLFGDF